MLPGGTICHSCGMVIMRADEFGTTETGVKKLDYCGYCYRKGQFTEPDLTMEGMIEKLMKPMKLNKNISDEQAREGARATIANLKRWKEAKK